MEFQDFNPYLRYINKAKIYRSYLQFLRAYDFRLFYITEGRVSLEFEKQTFSLSEKDLIIFPPGISYKLVLEKEKSVTYYVLNFDFDHVSENKNSRVPVPVKQFNPKDIFSTSTLPPFDRVFVLKNAIFAEEILEELIELELTQPVQNKYIKTILLEYLLVKCILKHKKTETLSFTQILIEKTKEYIRKNIMNCPSNKAIAKAIGYHPYYLNSLFVNHEHITLHKYMDNVRLKRAKDLLLFSNLPICDIAEQSGFSDASYFSRIFKKNFGLTPKQYRELSK